MADGSLDSIERRVAEDREALARSLDKLSAAVDSDHVKTQLSQTAETYGRQVWDKTRENPAAFALLSAGAAILLSGLGQRSERPLDHAAVDRGAEPRPFVHREPPHSGRMRAALNRGLDKLPTAARQKVVQARAAAIRAQESVERRTRGFTDKPAGIVQRYPLESAALGLGLGAICAALLPSTRQEDEYLGRRRDALMAAARDALGREVDNVTQTANRGDRPVHRPMPTARP